MRDQLETTINELRQQLASTEEMDAKELQQLRDAIEEISTTLDQKDVDSASLAQRLHDQTEAFQESHPVLTRTIGRIADMLAQMGI